MLIIQRIVFTILTSETMMQVNVYSQNLVFNTDIRSIKSELQGKSSIDPVLAMTIS